jgi:hypothetical protein
MMPQFCSIHLTFNRGCFKAVNKKYPKYCRGNVLVMQIDYVKISYEDDVHICCTNFSKKIEQNLHESTNWWKTYGKQLFSKDLEV